MNGYQALKIGNSEIKKELAHESIAKDINTYGDIAIGTDVEMLWLRKKTNGYNFFRADSLFVHDGVCGTDGRTIISELRNTPATDIHIFTKSMEKVLQICSDLLAVKSTADYPHLDKTRPYGMNIYHMMQKYNIELPESIGTHIHFGVKDQTEETYAAIIQAMDIFVMPIAKCFEPTYGHYIRTKCGFYGDFSEYRNKPYGIEYKSLPCVLDNKDVFIGIFALAKALAFEIITKNITGEDLKFFKISKDNVQNTNYLRRIVMRAKIFAKKNCRFYWVYKDLIDKMFDLALCPNPKSVFENDVNILDAWGIETDAEAFSDEYINVLRYGIYLPREPIIGYEGELGESLYKSSAYSLVYSRV